LEGTENFHEHLCGSTEVAYMNKGILANAVRHVRDRVGG